MNPFSESYNSNSSRAKFNRRKHDDSYFSRISNDTLEWIYHQSPLKQIFYVIVLIVFVIIFTAIYLMYTDHHVFQSEPLIMANSTAIISEPVVVEQTSTTQATTSSTPKPSDHHHHHHHYHHYPWSDNIPLKEPVAPMVEKMSEEKVNQSKETQSTSENPPARVPILTKTMDTTTTTTTSTTTTTTPTTTTTTTTTIKPITITSLMTNSTPELRVVSQSLSTLKVPDSHRHYPHPNHHHVTTQTAPTTTPATTSMDRSSSLDVSKPLIGTESTSTQLSPIEVLDELDQLIEYKCNSLNKTDNIESPEKVDMKHLLHLASQMRNLNGSKSLCSFIGLNHLVIPSNNPDYYWFKNYSLDFDSDDDFFDDWNPNPRDNCSGLTELIDNKLNRFWDSCMNANENITDFRNYMNSIGFKSYLPINISEFELNELIKSLDYQGLVNFRPIPDHLNLNATINLVNRDDYPFIQDQIYNELIDYPDLIKYLNWDETNEDIKSINTEGLKICQSIQELPYNKTERINLNPIEYNSLSLSDLPINAIPNADYLIEYNPNYLTDALTTINKEQSIDLYYYLLFTNLKKNLIHLNQSIDYINIIDYDSHLNRTSFCLNMVTLPFGLIQLMDKIKSSQSGETNLPKLADHLINKVIKLILSKFTDNQATRNLLRNLSYNILEQLNHLISLDSNSIDEIYQSLKITDNYFDNVQSIRSWLRSGYKEGCLLNYISI